MSRPPAAEPPSVVFREANGARPSSRRHATALVALVASLCALAASATRAENRRYGDLRFDDAGWVVEKESTSSLVLRPDNEIVGEHVRLTLLPAKPAPEGLDAALEAAWTEALAGRTPSEEPSATDESEVTGGGRERKQSAATAPAGGVLVEVVAVGDFASRLTLTASTDLAWGVAGVLAMPLLASLEVVPKEPPRVTAEGTGGGGGGPLPAFDWDGPDRIEWGIYDPGCKHVDFEFNQLLRKANSLVDSVAPRALSWSQALASARRLLADPAAKAAFDAAHQLAAKGELDLYSTGAAARLQQGDGAGALAHLLAGAEKAPSDPDRLFDFASGLAMAGLANESLATLERLRGLGKAPRLALGIDAGAAIDYVEGYDEMLLGRLTAAKSKLGAATREPFLYEARHALALVQAHEGNSAAGKATYRQGMYRFQPKRLLDCGGEGDLDDVRPPVDEMFDTSMGVEGKLVPFWHPQKADMLEKWGKAMSEIAEERRAAFDKYTQRALAISETLHAPQGPDAYEVWADKMSDLIDSLEEDEPIVIALQERVEAASENLHRVAGEAGSAYNRKVMALALSGKQNICHEIKAASSAGINAVSPAVHRFEVAHRENARVWYKIATGLASNLGGKWHDFHDANLRGTLEAWNLGFLAETMGVYGQFGSGEIPSCTDDEEAPATGLYEAPPTTPCEQYLKNLKIKHSFDVPGSTMGPKIGYEISCEKIKAEIEYDVVGGKWEGFGTGLGGFASVEIGKRGNYTVFAGARGDVTAPGTKGSVKSGLYIEGNESGDVTGFGGRFEMSGQLGGSATVKAKETMNFNLLPTPASPARGRPAMQPFRPRN